MCGCLSCAPYWGPGPQHRHVPWLGIEPVTLWFAGPCSIHWATPARAGQQFWIAKFLVPSLGIRSQQILGAALGRERRRTGRSSERRKQYGISRKGADWAGVTHCSYHSIGHHLAPQSLSFLVSYIISFDLFFSPKILFGKFYFIWVGVEEGIRRISVNGGKKPNKNIKR